VATTTASAGAAPALRSRELPEGYAPPRDPFEIQLVAACSRALGLTPIGIREPLAELGLDEVSAAPTASLASERLGRGIDGSELAAAGDVESAAVIMRARPITGRFDCVVPIQAVDGPMPLFGIHPAGGHVSSYTHLAREMGVGQPFYGIHSPALEPSLTPHESVDSLAAEYAGALDRRVDGPLALVGWSFGGGVAFEMARRLRSAGRDVTLVILDFGPDDQATVPEDPEDVCLMLLTYAFRLGDQAHCEAMAAMGRERALPVIERRATENGKLPPGFGLERLRRMHELNVINLTALKAHRFGTYDSKLTLLRASDREAHMPSESGDPALGWTAIAAEVEVLDTPGTHFDFLGRANLPHVARMLGEQVGAAEARSARARTSRAHAK
jgi:thioesterase domain-containing protein